MEPQEHRAGCLAGKASTDGQGKHMVQESGVGLPDLGPHSVLIHRPGWGSPETSKVWEKTMVKLKNSYLAMLSFRQATS